MLPAKSGRLRAFSQLSRFRRTVQERVHVFQDLPEAAVQGEVVVHQVDQVIVVVHVLEDHARGGLLFVQLGPLLNPQGKGLILSEGGREREAGHT